MAEITKIEGWRCAACGTFDQEYAGASLCCPPDKGMAYLCSVCGDCHDEQEEAEECCMAKTARAK